MSLTLDEEQVILKNSAHEFFAERIPVSTLRKLRDSADGQGFDASAWHDMAALGWAGILVPEAYGGADFGYVGLGQVLEESGRTLAASPLISTALIGAPLLAAAGSAAQKENSLNSVCGGQRLLALAIDEGPRHAPEIIRTRAARDGDDFVLNGEKNFVIDGHVADQVIVVARTAGESAGPGGLTLFLLETGAAGLTSTPILMVDSRYVAQMRFDNVRVNAEAVIGKVDGAGPVLEPILDGARAGIAAEMLGSGLEAFERTLAYLKLRHQFDVPIGSFQALKHRAALMLCEIELTRSAVLAALNALDNGDVDSAELASLAKAKACDMLELISNEAVQMHGGIGMTDAEEIGFFLKRARVQQQIFGDAGFHRDRYATLKGF